MAIVKEFDKNADIVEVMKEWGETRHPGATMQSLAYIDPDTGEKIYLWNDEEEEGEK